MGIDAKVCADATWLLGNFDAEKREFGFVKTSESHLRAMPFHDGRVPLGVSEQIHTLKLDRALDWLAQHPLQTRARVIAHTSFCGSTLLTRLLDAQPGVFCFREPQVLIDLANLKAANHDLCRNPVRWQTLVQFTVRQLGKHFADVTHSVVKPSNWANNLLSDLPDDAASTRAVIVTSSLTDFLLANLRGGKPRLNYTLQLLNHLTQCNSYYFTKVEETELQTLEPMQRVLRQVAICHHAQNTQVATFSHNLPKEQCLHLEKVELLLRLDQSLRAATEILELPAATDLVRASQALLLGLNAKTTGKEIWHARAEIEANEIIWGQYGQQIESVKIWYASTLAPQAPSGQPPQASNL